MKLERTPDKGFGRAIYFTWGKLYIAITNYCGNVNFNLIWGSYERAETSQGNAREGANEGRV